MLEHYGCMVDLLGRAVHFDNTMEIIEFLASFLGSCQKWANVDLAWWAFENTIRLDEKCTVCMSNVHAAAGMQEEANKVKICESKMEH